MIIINGKKYKLIKEYDSYILFENEVRSKDLFFKI